MTVNRVGKFIDFGTLDINVPRDVKRFFSVDRTHMRINLSESFCGARASYIPVTII